MKTLIKSSLLVLLLSSLLPATGFALPEANPVPGGIVLLSLKNNQIASSARYENKRLASFQENGVTYLLIGLPLSSKTGQHKVQIKTTDNQQQQLSFEILPKTYKAQYLTIKNKRKVNPYQQDMPRILSEKKRKNKARRQFTEKAVMTDFVVPVDGRISSIFGLRRFFNEQPRRPHTGLDIAAPQGTPIKALADGEVIESGDFFFSGNMIYLDHGQGLITLYAHLHTLNVKPGDKVIKGQIIGSVGETGRVTGPHLHLSVIANQTLVDPLLFLPQLKPKAAEYFKSN